MTDGQYQRLIGIIFLVGSASASRPWSVLFLVFGVVAMIQSYFASRESDSESHSADADKDN
jgi:hypothetical protein